MKRRVSGLPYAAWLAWLFVLLGAAGCAMHASVPERLLGSSEHHLSNGVKLLGKGRLDAAHREFRITIELDPECALAHRGEAIVLGMRGDFDAAFTASHRAVRYTTTEDLRNPIQEEFSRCGSIRWSRSSRWRRTSTDEDMASLARPFVAAFLNGYYHMGIAYKFGRAHEEHEESLKMALFVTDAFSEEASRHLRTAGAFDEFALGTELGRGMTFLDRLSRAEVAALLVREIGLADLIEKPDGGTFQPAPEPAWHSDLAGHPLEEDLRVIVGMGIDGFVLFEDGSLRLDAPMLREEYACAAVDILARVHPGKTDGGKGPQLAPFEDVSLSSPCLRAVAACADLGVMSAENGRFRPDAPISGLEAAQSIQRLKELIARPRQ